MVGAFTDEGSAPGIGVIAIITLVAAIVALLLIPDQRVTFDGAFLLDSFARYMKILTLAGAAVTVAMTLAYARHQSFQRFEYPVLILLSSVGMMLMISANDMIAVYLGLELQSLARVRGGVDQPRLDPLHRGRPQVLRARGAVVGPAALRHQPRLRLHRLDAVRRHRRDAGADGDRPRGDLRHRVRARRPRLQGLRGPVPHVDARRLRGRAEPGDRVHRGGAEGRRHRAVRARGHGSVRPGLRPSGSRSSSSSPSCRCCSARSPPSGRPTSSG